IQVDIDVDRIGRNYPVNIPVVGDAQTVLIELIYHIHRLIREHAPPQSQWMFDTESQPERRYKNEDLRVSEQLPMTPQRWRVELEKVLSDDAIVFSDIGGHMLFNIHHLCIRAQQKFVLNLGFGSMGHGTAGPIGAALAHNDRQVVAIIGDACFMMNGMELITAAEYDIPVIWLVENNQMHGITWHGSATLGDPMHCVVNRRPLDVAGIARAMGLAAYVAERPEQL